jgi:hypothetical protein
MEQSPRQAVLDQLATLPDVSWLMAIASIRGPQQVLALAVMDDGTPEAALVVTIDTEIARLGAK